MSRFLSATRMIMRQPGFLGILASNFALGMAYSFVTPFMSMWGTLHIGMSPTRFGVFMTFTSVSAIVLSIMLARWSDTHITRRTTLLCGGTAGMIGYLGYSYFHNIVALTITGSLFLGVAQVNFSQTFAHMREELARPENAGADAALLMSMLRVSFSLAWTVGPAIGAWTMIHYSYHGIFLGAAVLSALFTMGVACFVPKRAHSPTIHAYARQPLAKVLTRRDIVAYFTGFLLFFAAFNINIMNLPLMVTQQLGGTERNIGIIYSVAPVFEVPLMIWFGHLAARGHQYALIRFGVLAGTLYFSTLLLAHEPWQIYPMQILSAVSIAITTNITITFFQDLLPGQAGVATSIYSNSFSGGSLVGYFIFGLSLETFGHRGVFVVCAVLSLVTFAILTIYRPRPLASVSVPVLAI
jgi:MFS transporter, SET family, sugar efflux transporter